MIECWVTGEEVEDPTSIEKAFYSWLLNLTGTRLDEYQTRSIVRTIMMARRGVYGR